MLGFEAHLDLRKMRVSWIWSTHAIIYFVSKVPYITLTGGSGGPYYSYYGAGGGGVMINGEGPTSTTYGRGQVIILILLHSWVLRMNTIVLYC